MEYYDLVLGMIPASLLGVSGLLRTAGIDLALAVPLAAAVAAVLIGHAMFVRSPVPGRSTSSTSADSPESPAATPTSSRSSAGDMAAD